MQKLTQLVQFTTIVLALTYTTVYLMWRGLLMSPLYESSWQLQLSEVFWAWFYLPLVPLLLLGLLAWNRRALVVLCIPLLFFLWEYGVQFLPNWQNGITQPAVHAQNQTTDASSSTLAPSTQSSPLKVMTWNSFRTYSIADGLEKALLLEQPDIVTIQEVSTGLRRQLGQEYAHIFPYQYNQLYGSLTTLSRYPLSKPKYDRLMQMGCRCLPMELEWNGRRLTIINIHIPRPTVLYNIGSGLPTVRRFDPRSQELHYKVLFKMLDEIEGPLLLQGDINTTERQPNFRRLTQTLKDSFAEAGWGMGFTYPNSDKGPAWLIPLVQIDHILHSQEMVALSAHTGLISSSDHLYVLATLRWR